MKKKVLAVVAIACVACLAMAMVAGCSGKKSSEASRTKLVVGFDQDFPPYGYVGDDGQFTGFDLDLAAEVAKRNKWEVEYKPISWDAKDLELSSGAIDCIWNGFTIEGREDGYTWTDPYMENSQVIVVKADSGITDFAGLAGKTVITQADSAALGVLEDAEGQATLAATFKQLLTTPEFNTAFMELDAGSVDAVACDSSIAGFQMAGKTDAYRVLSEKLSTEHFGVGFLKGKTDLRDAVQKTLKEMVADGTVKKLCEKYADQDISYDNWVLAAK